MFRVFSSPFLTYTINLVLLVKGREFDMIEAMDTPLKQRNLGHVKTRKQSQRLKRRFLITSLVLAVCVATFCLLMNQSYFQVKELEIQGLTTISEADLSASVQEYLSEKTFLVIPRSNIFFIQKQRLKKRLQTSYPRIADLDITLMQADLLSLELQEREARLLWCVDVPYASVFDEECYFTDDSGLLYTKAPYFSDRVFLKVFVPPELQEIKEEGSFFSQTEIIEFLTFIKALEERYDIGILRAYLDTFGDMRLVIYRIYDTVLDGEPEIIYTQDQSYDELLRNIDLTLMHDSFVRNFNQHPERFEKIDLRFDGRLIYKFKVGS